ncbi:hypothetical protein BH11PLA1_BH11PLA1_18860 [soil metagenome]
MSTPLRTLCARRGGFTLIEMLCTICILATIAMVTSGLIFQASAAFVAAGTGAQLSGELSGAMERVAREVRMIPAKSGTSGVVADLNGIGSISILYGLGAVAMKGDALTITEGAGTQCTILENASIAFEALDNQGAVIAEPVTGPKLEQVQRVRITLSATRGSETQTLRTVVFIRSLMAGAKRS